MRKMVLSFDREKCPFYFVREKEKKNPRTKLVTGVLRLAESTNPRVSRGR